MLEVNTAPVVKTPSKKSTKASLKKAALAQETGIHITFVDIAKGEPEPKKESFVNEVEAEAMLDYYTTFLQTTEISELPNPSLYLTSPFRT
mgnify:CR=1 FL=1